MTTPAAGDLLYLTRLASVQFGLRPITARVIRALTDRHTYDGWLWIDVYELGPDGTAVRRREVYVQHEGLRWVPRRQGSDRRGPR